MRRGVAPHGASPPPGVPCDPETGAYAGGIIMNDHVYKLIELTGTSATSIEDAVNTAIARANKTLKGLSWFQVTETRGNIENGKVLHWQVTLKVGFRLEG
jgi:flavin-binding protein dodecin